MAAITKDMGILEVVEKWPDTVRIFMDFAWAA